MKLNVFTWVVRDDTKPVSYDCESPNPRVIYRLSIRSESTGNWLWYVKLRYGLLVAKYQTRHLWVEQYVSVVDTTPERTSLLSKIKSARAKLTRAENKLKLAEKVASETLDFGENQEMLAVQREKVIRLRNELNNLLNS